MQKVCKICGRTSDEVQVNYCSEYGDYLCSKHKNQWIRRGKITDGEKEKLKCGVCGSRYTHSNRVHWCSAANMYLCLKHRDQFARLGKFLDRTRRDENVFVTGEEYAAIIFYDHKGNEIGRSLIDKEDIEKCRQHRWLLTEPMGNTRYVKSVIDGKNTGLHRFIIEAEDGVIVDHINRNGLDNRKQNLRCVSSSENSVNSRTRSSSGEKNIYVKNGLFQVQIVRNYKNVFCRTFKTLEEAILARDQFIKEYNQANNRKI